MKKTFIILVALFLSLNISAQKRGKKVKEPVYTVTPQEAMATYDFKLAEEILEHQIADLTKKKQPTIHEEALAAVMERAFAGADALTVTRQNGCITATADCTFFHYEITLAEDTGYPTGIAVPELNIEIIITDYTPAAGI